MKAIILAGCLLLCACAAARTVPERTLPENCPKLHVLLPGNYVIDLAAGADLVLDPARQEFVLYCSEKDASQALKHALADGQIANMDDWAVYILEEDAGEVAFPCHKEDICLKKPATVIDWADKDGSKEVLQGNS